MFWITNYLILLLIEVFIPDIADAPLPIYSIEMPKEVWSNNESMTEVPNELHFKQTNIVAFPSMLATTLSWNTPQGSFSSS